LPNTRSAINTLAQVNDMAEALNSPLVGVAIDVADDAAYATFELENNIISQFNSS